MGWRNLERGLKDEDFDKYPYQVFSEMVSKIPNLKHRAFIAVTYAASGRVSEIVRKLTKDSITKETYVDDKTKQPIEYLGFKIKVLKKRKLRQYPKDGSGEFLDEKNGKRYNILPAPKPLRKILLRMDETWASQTILDYIKDLKDKDILFKINRATAWKIVHKYFEKPFTTHTLRHLRVTHLLVHWKMQDSMIIKVMGWEDGKQLMRYGHLRTEDTKY